MCEKASKVHMMSALIVCHAIYKNRVMKPSGPIALSGGRVLITFHTSALVRHSSWCDRSRQGRSKCSKLMEFERVGGVPSTMLKKSNTSWALCSSVIPTRHSCSKEWMYF
jgi:hypothetical protein